MSLAKQQNQRPELELNSFLPYLLVNLSKRMSATLAAIYQADYDLTIPEWRILANLNQAGALTSKEIALQTYMDKVKVCRAIKTLSDKGWVEKRSHQTDSRAYLVSLSRAGQQVIDAIIPKALGWQATMLEALSAEEQAALRSAIDNLSDWMDESGAAAQFVARLGSDFDI